MLEGHLDTISLKNTVVHLIEISLYFLVNFSDYLSKGFSQEDEKAQVFPGWAIF